MFISGLGVCGPVRSHELVNAWCRKARTTFLALHYLADATALAPPERDAARRTPWRDRLAREEWFGGTYQVFLRERDA